MKGFLERSSQEYDIETVQIDFHGGEPLLMGKERFERACRELVSGDYKKTKLNMVCQTNVWKKVYGDSRHIQRYSKADNFNRETVFCPSVRKIMSYAASYLIESGISEDIIMQNLEVNS